MTCMSIWLDLMIGFILKWVKIWHKWMKYPFMRLAATSSIDSWRKVKRIIRNVLPNTSKNILKRLMINVKDFTQKAYRNCHRLWQQSMIFQLKRTIWQKFQHLLMKSLKKYHWWVFFQTCYQKWKTWILRRKYKRQSRCQLKEPVWSPKFKIFAHRLLINSKRSIRIYRRR